MCLRVFKLLVMVSNMPVLDGENAVGHYKSSAYIESSFYVTI